jgi:hypothetical protein
VQNSGGLGISNFDELGFFLRSAGSKGAFEVKSEESLKSFSSNSESKSKGFFPKKRPNDLPNESETC